MSDESVPLKVEVGRSRFRSGEVYVAVWRRHKRPDGGTYDDIDEELYATPGEWREIVRQISELLETEAP